MNGISLQSHCRALSVLVMMTCTLLFSLQAKAEQGDAAFTLTANNITLSAVFKAIYQQTKMAIVYNNRALDDKQKVDVDFRNTKLEDVLHYLLDKRGFLWVYNGNYISISPSAGKENDNNSRGDTAANTLTIAGKVTDAVGAPLVGASIQVKGTLHGAITDVDGKFILPRVTNSDVLIIRSVGYETRELPVKGRHIMAQLNVVVNDLDETVIIAYGATTKRRLIGNVGSVKGEDIAKQPVSNPLLALQGRVPGLFITQSTGLPGGGVTVRLQGTNSISSGNDPLYVIDGIPYASQLLPTWGSVLGESGGMVVDGVAPGNGNPLSFINPSDIESIDILKDADATAIYGSRAANGAILITTKKGKAGKTKIDLNMQQGWGRVTNQLPLMDTRQYVAMRKEALKNDGLQPSVDPAAAFPFVYAPDLMVWDTTRNTDWQKQLIGGTAHYTDVKASVSGGNDHTQFLIGLGYHRETTVFPGSFSDQKGSVHFNINHASADEKLKLQFSGNYLGDYNNLTGTDFTTAAITLAPNAPEPYNPDGSINWAPNVGNTTWIAMGNPIANLYNKYKVNTKNLLGNLTIGYQLLPSVEIKTSLGYNSLQAKETGTQPLISTPPENWPYTLRAAQFSDNSVNTFIIEPQATFKHKIGKGILDALLGTTIQQTRSNGVRLSATGFNSDLVLEDIKAATSITAPFPTIATKYKYNALFSRISYNWQDKYLMNLSARRDGSSRFGRSNQFHNFGAAGAAWIFSNETAVQKLLPILSFGKIKASYGTTGSDQVGDYRFLNRYTIPFGIGTPYQGATALQPAGLPNPYLGWEETRKWQSGIELGFLKDRLLLTATYINNRSYNQLLAYGLPIVTGFFTVNRNFPAIVQNRNWELTLNTVNVKTRLFTWTTNINLTVPSNQLVDFPNLATSTYASLLVPGQPVRLTKTYHFTGVDPATGVYQFADAKGNPTSNPDFLNDRTVFINTDPTLYGGFQNTVQYKGFELDILFQFVKQQKQHYRYGNLPGIMQVNQPTSLLERWQKPGDITPNQRYNADASIVGAFFNILDSDAAYADASFIRLKNFSLSWQLPMSWKQKLRLQNCRVYLQAQNLLTITSFYGLDPETGNASLPPLKMLTSGIQIGF
ncbi:SusC/RagA family TonB-linked outer membrane protein [Chitinophaga agrisoli]|uniref:SusC/RagA family TonB-linked outer membrane protein n=1 Tax=Chitinophaga agrisoli TaxID=2607653 RepID=A0A5B2VN66_9BACT|nr:SusC/RagA family TonB-linked outer membrane protein [Chitinophaga agrisoli]KAA2239752.1 SusC/RagA family TonB-linked outer membrane protein [Chitinophaga agrisoli]